MAGSHSPSPILSSLFKDSLLSNSTFLMLNNFLNSGSGFVFWIIVAQFFTPAEVGLSIALVSVASIIISISRCGFDISVIRYLSQETDKTQFINTVLTGTAVATCAVALVSLGSVDLWATKIAFVRTSLPLLVTFVIFCLSASMLVITSNIFVAFRSSQYTLYINVIQAFLYIAFPVIFVTLLHDLVINRGYLIFSSWGLSLLIAMFVSLLFIRILEKNYYPNFKFDISILRKISHFSISNTAVSFFWLLPGYILPLMLLNIQSANESAYFFITFSISGFLLAISTHVSNSLLAEVSFNAATFSKNLRKALIYSLALLVPAVILTILLGDRVLLIFGSGYLLNGQALLIYLSIATVFAPPVSFYVTYLRMTLEHVQLIVISAVRSIGLLAVCYLFLQGGTGIVGIGYGFLLLNVVFALYAFYAFRRSGIL